MPSDDLRSEPTPGSLPGFQTYADDTPRGDEPLVAREPRSWGRAPPQAAPPEPPEPEGPGRIPTSRRRIGPLVGLGAAGLAALVGGVLLARAPSPAPAARVEAAATPMNLEVAAVKPAPIPSVAEVGKLDVLPRVAAARARDDELEKPAPPAAAPPTLVLPAPRVAAREPPSARSEQEGPALTAAPSERPSFACRDARTAARQMVCADMRLAALDRQMKQAYAAALAAGASPDALAADQDDWLDVREDAARQSRWAVASVYRQRIDELWDLVDRAPR